MGLLIRVVLILLLSCSISFGATRTLFVTKAGADDGACTVGDECLTIGYALGKFSAGMEKFI